MYNVVHLDLSRQMVNHSHAQLTSTVYQSSIPGASPYLIFVDKAIITYMQICLL